LPLNKCIKLNQCVGNIVAGAAIGFSNGFFLASSVLFLVKTRSQQVARNVALLMQLQLATCNVQRAATATAVGY